MLPPQVTNPSLPCEPRSSDPWWCVTHDSKWDLERHCYAWNRANLVPRIMPAPPSRAHDPYAKDRPIPDPEC